MRRLVTERAECARGPGPHLLLGVLAMVVNLPYAVLGSGFVLDDWFALRNAHFDGALAAAGHEQWLARPGQGLVYFLTFGLIGEHPLVFFVLQVVLSAVAAVLLYLVLRRLIEPAPSLVVAGLWLVIPNHASLVLWPSAVGILVALVLGLIAALLLTTPRPTVATEAGAALLLTASMLCYEATAPTGAVAALALPWIVHRSWRWRGALMVWAGLGLAGVWMVVNFHPAKAVVHVTGDLWQMLPAHFGWGVAPQSAPALIVGVLGLTGLGAVVVRAVGIGGRDREFNWLVLVGLALIVLGTVPFIRYYYAPLGAGDRVNVVAGVGTALCWCGLGQLAWRLRRPVAATATAFVLGSMIVAGIEGNQAWHDAGKTARRILAALPSRPPDGMLVVGPSPVERRNVAGFLDRSNIEAAVQLRYDDRSVTAGLSGNEREFASVPPERRIDVCRLVRCPP